MAGKDQKTEQPTQRRLQKAREEGNFASSRVFVSALQFLAFVIIVRGYGAGWVATVRESIAMLLNRALVAQLDSSSLIDLGLRLIKRTLSPLCVAAAILLAVTVGAQLLVTRFGVSLKRLSPDPKRLNPISKLKELPRQNIPSLLQAAVMLPVFAWIVVALVKGELEAFLSLPLNSVTSGAALIGGSLQNLLWKAALLFTVFGAVDFFRQNRRYRQDLRMSKQDLRDEVKESEGSPLVKSRIRRLRRDMARRRMMHEVAGATAVIINPTHYAVALKYSMNSNGAPKVVAKGKNYLALRIKQRAIDNGVPLIENPPLAQGLYKSVEVGQEIPAQFYRAVAEILAYVFRLMNERRSA